MAFTIVFEWEGKTYTGTAKSKSFNGIPGYEVKIGKRVFKFLPMPDSWSVLPFIKSYELKNRIAAAIVEAESNK